MVYLNSGMYSDILRLISCSGNDSATIVGCNTIEEDDAEDDEGSSEEEGGGGGGGYAFRTRCFSSLLASMTIRASFLSVVRFVSINHGEELGASINYASVNQSVQANTHIHHSHILQHSDALIHIIARDMFCKRPLVWVEK